MPWTSRMPAASLAAASTGVRTPLRLAGDASASIGVCFLRRLRNGVLGWAILDVAKRRVGEALTGEEEEPDSDADGCLDRLEADPEGDAVRLAHAVVHERERDRGLDEADVPGPEGKDRRDVDQHEHQTGRRDRQVDVERIHGRPDCEELA